MDTFSQEKHIIAYLQTGASLTRKECEEKGWGLELPARVFYLKRAGWNIQREMVLSNGKRIARYFLGEPHKTYNMLDN